MYMEQTKADKKYNCEKCCYTTIKLQNWTKHLNTTKHNSEPNIYKCEKCSYETTKTDHWEEHLKTKKHSRPANYTNQFSCEKCGFFTTKIQHYEAHLATLKHCDNELDNTVKVLECKVCNIQCTSASLMKRHLNTQQHKARAYDNNTNTDSSIEALTKETNALKQMMCQVVASMNSNNNEVIKTLVADNAEMKEMMSKVMETCSTNIITNTVNTVNNTANFNINVFLNETCKNAMNMTDFIQSIQFTHEDLEQNGELGFVDGMIRLIGENLKKLDITERPMHCTDLKRETIYIKDDGRWSKENSIKKIHSGITRLSKLGGRVLHQWKLSEPDYQDGDSEFSIKAMRIQRTLQSGYDTDAWYPRVVRGIAKQILVDKTTIK
jgi:hypothetical protein